MIRQAEVFLKSEGDAWLERNKGKLTGENDPVLDAIETCGIKPFDVLEVGCSNGWRLEALAGRYGCDIVGVDPAASVSDFLILRGTANSLPITKQYFDMVIYGWCLYLCDREDLFDIAAEGDRVLRDEGHLVIYDFHSYPHKRKYKHKEGLFSFKCDYPKLWLGNPTYRMVFQRVYGSGDDQTAVTILKKSIKDGWPLRD